MNFYNINILILIKCLFIFISHPSIDVQSYMVCNIRTVALQVRILSLTRELYDGGNIFASIIHFLHSAIFRLTNFAAKLSLERVITMID